MSQLTISKAYSSQSLSIIESRGQNTDKKSPSCSLIEKVKSFFIRFLQTVLSIFCCRKTEAKDIAISLCPPNISITASKPDSLPQNVSKDKTSKSTLIDLLPKASASQTKPDQKKRADLHTPKDNSKKKDANSKRPSNYNEMPQVLVSQVTSFLDYKSVLALEKVSRHFRQSVNQQNVWKPLARRDIDKAFNVRSKKEYIDKIVHLRINKWVQRKWGHLDSGNRNWDGSCCDRIVQKIIEVLKDPAYQKDPKAYLLAWEKARGHTEELRIPEDPARSFFKSGNQKEIFY